MNCIDHQETRLIEVPATDGFPDTLFELFDNEVCLEVVEDIFAGQTYSVPDQIKDPGVIVDVGANVGATTFYLARMFPAATVLAFEPYPPAFKLLEKNTAKLANVRCFPFGLYDSERKVPLYLGKQYSVTNSIGRVFSNSNETVDIQLREAPQVMRELGVDRIGILKLDTEGCELPIFNSLVNWLPSVQSVYVEYHSEEDRLAIDQLLHETHILTSAKVLFPHRGELNYINYNTFTEEMPADQHKIDVLENRA